MDLITRSFRHCIWRSVFLEKQTFKVYLTILSTVFSRQKWEQQWTHLRNVSLFLFLWLYLQNVVSILWKGNEEAEGWLSADKMWSLSIIVHMECSGLKQALIFQSIPSVFGFHLPLLQRALLSAWAPLRVSGRISPYCSHISQAWHHMPVVTALRRWMQEIVSLRSAEAVLWGQGEAKPHENLLQSKAKQMK